MIFLCVTAVMKLKWMKVNKQKEFLRCLELRIYSVSMTSLDYFSCADNGRF